MNHKVHVRLGNEVEESLLLAIRKTKNSNTIAIKEE